MLRSSGDRKSGPPRSIATPKNRLVTRWPQIVVLFGLLAYLLVSLNRLAVFPPLGEDESWIAAAPYKLATQGVLGSDLITGYYGVERHHYETDEEGD